MHVMHPSNRCFVKMGYERFSGEKSNPSKNNPNPLHRGSIPQKTETKKPSVGPSERIVPQPLGEKCSAYCPLFFCTRNAVFMVNKPVKGRLIKVAQCRLTGGDCINGECQYASCRLNSLLPDGRCSKALEKKIARISDEDLFKRMRSFEEYDISDFTRLK